MTFERVTVFGGGLIGSGWATNYVMAGVEVTVYDTSQERIDNARSLVEHHLSFFSDPEINIISAQQKEAMASSIRYTYDVQTAVRDAQFIQENGPEKLTVKQSIIASIEEYNADAIIASSTSGLMISEIAANAKHPERIVAGHPFNPVHLMPLVEICGGEKASPEAVEKAKMFYTEIGKEPVVLNKEISGFLCNRMQIVLGRELQELVHNGYCSVGDGDRAVVFGMGLRLGLIGPHMVWELAGGPGGIREQMTKYGSEKDQGGGTLASMGKRPEGYIDIAADGVREELLRRKPEHGQDHDSLERFRDKGLVYLLRYHGKY